LFFKKNSLAPNQGAILSEEMGQKIAVRTQTLGYILGDFKKNLSGHPAQQTLLGR
jgi:hypothetical protein